MEKKTVFLTAGVGKLNIHMQRMKVDAYLTPLTKINLKWIMTWPETTKVLDETMGVSSLTLVLTILILVCVFVQIWYLKHKQQKQK